MSENCDKLEKLINYLHLIVYCHIKFFIVTFIFDFFSGVNKNRTKSPLKSESAFHYIKTFS